MLSCLTVERVAELQVEPFDRPLSHLGTTSSNGDPRDSTMVGRSVAPLDIGACLVPLEELDRRSDLVSRSDLEW